MDNVSYKLLIRPALEEECPEAMFRAACRYNHGAGVERDMEKARAEHEFAM